MKKMNVCVLFGGISPEHEVSLRSAESVLNNMDCEKYNIYPVGISKEGQWILFGGTDYSCLPAGTWQEHADNCRAMISPERGKDFSALMIMAFAIFLLMLCSRFFTAKMVRTVLCRDFCNWRVFLM